MLRHIFYFERYVVNKNKKRKLIISITLVILSILGFSYSFLDFIITGRNNITSINARSGKSGSTNQNYFLTTGSYYWTISPYLLEANSIKTLVFLIMNTRLLTNHYTNVSYGVRPVINLKPNVTYSSGIGTESNPYIIS